MDNSDLLVNLVIAVGAGLAGALVAARLGQSVILGYLVGGILIGPETPGFVADAQTVDDLANIGVILLLFAVGVQLSFRDLLSVGKVAIGGGVAQVLITIGVGYAVGRLVGWDSTQSLFFGAVLSNSSSTVIGKVLGDRGEVATPQGTLSVAWSSVQDFGSRHPHRHPYGGGRGGREWRPRRASRSLGEATLFLVLLLPMGAYVFPWFFERVAALRQREVLVLSIAAVAFGTAYASSFFGLSLALGAFAGGVAVAESDESHNIVREVLPLRDIFAGLFFVSVGMLVDPGFLVENLPLVLLVVALTVVFKGALSSGIALLARVPAGTAVLSGVLLGQSAEFSFLMARVGRDLGAVDASAFSTMLAGAAGSIALVSVTYEASKGLARRVEAALGARALEEMRAAAEPPRRDHVIICGYGRVGKVIGRALRRQGIPFVVIEEDREVIRDLAGEDIPTFMGAADNPALLDLAGVQGARAVIVTVPDPSEARRVVDYTLQVNPEALTVVRTHSEVERRFLEGRGASEAVMGEHGIALEMIRRTLGDYGVAQEETQYLIDRLRSTDSEWESSLRSED